MPDRIKLASSTPATLDAVVEAVVKLSRLGESEISELASSGKLKEIFPFHPSVPTEAISDFAKDDELVDASPLPLSTRQYAELILASMHRGAKGSPTFENNAEPGDPQDFELLVREIRALNSKE